MFDKKKVKHIDYFVSKYKRVFNNFCNFIKVWLRADFNTNLGDSKVLIGSRLDYIFITFGSASKSDIRNINDIHSRALRMCRRAMNFILYSVVKLKTKITLNLLKKKFLYFIFITGPCSTII